MTPFSFCKEIQHMEIMVCIIYNMIYANFIREIKVFVWNEEWGMWNEQYISIIHAYWNIKIIVFLWQQDFRKDCWQMFMGLCTDQLHFECGLPKTSAPFYLIFAAVIRAESTGDILSLLASLWRALKLCQDVKIVVIFKCFWRTRDVLNFQILPDSHENFTELAEQLTLVVGLKLL